MAPCQFLFATRHHGMAEGHNNVAPVAALPARFIPCPTCSGHRLCAHRIVTALGPRRHSRPDFSYWAAGGWCRGGLQLYGPEVASHRARLYRHQWEGMEYRKLGRSGLQVSVVGLGTNYFGRRVDADGAAIVISGALDVGINMIDTANTYGQGLSEEYIGRALKGRRHQAIIGTKVSGRMGEGPNQAGNSRQHIMSEVENSLRRLDTDYIDLYQIHFADPTTPTEETLRALDDLVHQGKVRYIGCSNFMAWQVCEAVLTSRNSNLTPLVSVQSRYSMLDRAIEAELVPFCTEYRIGIIPYYPLASGFLTGKYRRGLTPPSGDAPERERPGYPHRRQLRHSGEAGAIREGAWA